MISIVWPCGGHNYEDVGVVCGACHDAEAQRLRAIIAELLPYLTKEQREYGNKDLFERARKELARQ